MDKTFDLIFILEDGIGNSLGAEDIRLVKKEVVGVLEFFSPETKEPDERLLDVMAHIGIQMGRIFERLR